MIRSLKFLYLIITVTVVLSSCDKKANDKVEETDDLKSFESGTFGYDLNFLQGYDSGIVLLGDENSQVIVSPKYQGKVFTSTANGNEGQSFGWINYKIFSAPIDAHMNAYGGENRFWLGPEGGVFSLYFEKGKEMVFDNWKTPAPIDTDAWSVTTKDNQHVSLQKEMTLINYAGTQLSLMVERKITMLNNTSISNLLGIQVGDSIQSVGYETENMMTNTGSNEWNEKTGMPCIWMLDMFKPSSGTVIVIPYKTEGIDSSVKIATTDYFGEIPSDRISYNDGVLLFKADGKRRSKLGIGPLRAKPIAGSYDAENKILTVTMFDVDSSGLYLNQEWSTTKPTFSGDAVNAYNDGPLDDGSIMGPFYEIESVSPAAFLKPGEALSHQHSVFHFTGSETSLDGIVQKLFGVSINDLSEKFL